MQARIRELICHTRVCHPSFTQLRFTKHPLHRSGSGPGDDDETEEKAISVLKEPLLEEHRWTEGHKIRRQVLGGNWGSLGHHRDKLTRLSLKEQGALEEAITGLNSEG